ncbi:MAG: chromophore lyase CpcT/CpeT [Prochlorococcus sp.]
MSDQTLLHFAKILAGHYSNFAQAQENPKDFSHINIYFRPLPWQVLQGPGFYSEQSHDHDPWRPYRQGLHRLIASENMFVMENYGLTEPERVAGGGFREELLKRIGFDEQLHRSGCNMHFKEVTPGHYRGEVEPGNQCLIPRDGKMTYLISEVEVNAHTWISRDRGFDPSNDEQCWGSEHGLLRFKRVANLGDNLNEAWLRPCPPDAR